MFEICLYTCHSHDYFLKSGYLVANNSKISKCVCRSDPAKFREDLMNIARTTLSSKILTQHKDYFANLAVDAVLRLKVNSLVRLLQLLYVYSYHN